MASLPSTPDVNRSLEFLQTSELPRKTKLESEHGFTCTTRYTKAHATMTWEIRDVSARDTHGERLRSAEFTVGQGAKRTSWIILCSFGTQNYEDYVSAHVKLVTKASQVCADVELSIVGAYGTKVNTETKTARLFSNCDGAIDSSANNESTWGYFSFAKRADLRFNPEWVPNDTLTLTGRVSVYGDDETISTLDADSDARTLTDVHLESLAADLTALFVDAQSGDDGDLAGSACTIGEDRRDTIIIATPDKEYKVHQSVLSARSMVFRRMFQQSNSIGATSAPEVRESSDTGAAAAAGVPAAWSESGSRLVSIPDVNDDVMRHFLLYLYGSRVPEDLDEQLAEELLVVADKYDVERLKNACESALSGSLTTSNVPRLLVIADRHRCSKLKAGALAYLTANPSQILASSDWKMVETNHPSLVADALRTMAGLD